MKFSYNLSNFFVVLSQRFKAGGFFVMLLNLEKESKKVKAKNAITDGTCNKLKPVGSKPRTFYGSAKVHKPLKNGNV